ncbi:tyrosine-type recombinase/integrase [Microtetraspora malaysiensis]|uniref:tyrosine-type recombinase/integrase n=1 Tax=Microtetraspora malaysiensis TaxID=161358 RepID=UPI003D8F2256
MTTTAWIDQSCPQVGASTRPSRPPGTRRCRRAGAASCIDHELDLHQLRHSAATHLGGAEVPLQLIMGKTRHKNPRTAMRYVRPGAEPIAKITEVLAPRQRTH